MEKYNFQYCPKLVVLSADKTKVLLCKRKDEADYDGTFSFIGGKMEITDASIVDGIKREKDEEVGANFEVSLYPNFSLNILFKKKNGSVMIVPHYLAIYNAGEVTLNTDEYSEYKWITLGDLETFEPKIQNIPETIAQILLLGNMAEEADFVSI